MLKVNRKKDFASFISQTLIARSLDSDDKTWEESEDFKNFVISSEQLDVFSLECIDSQNKVHVLCVVKVSSEINNDIIVEKINKQLINKKYIKLTFLWIVNSLRDKLCLKKQQSIINRKLKVGKKIEAPCYFIFKDDINGSIELTNIKRYEMLIMPPISFNGNIKIEQQEQNVPSFNGYVFSVSLYELVNIYNEVGDELFKRNLRFGIGEQLGVDEAIQQTLRENPEYFWFRNNGVTIIVKEPDTILEKPNSILLQPKRSEELRFSVVNGAQTITTAAKYYYELEAKIDELETQSKKEEGANDNIIKQKIKELKAAQKAKVILRIIQFQEKGDLEEVKKISVALNRQKPIKMEDIAYTNSFINQMNVFLRNENKGYNLCRRGEVISADREISIVDFARARKAISGDPGKARAVSSFSMLKIEKEKFTDKTIFIDEWYGADETTQSKIFKRNYNPIIFAIKLANKYDEIKKDCGKTSLENTIIENGKWYFVSLIIYILNGGNQEDYTNFAFNQEIIFTRLDDLIKSFAQYYIECFSTEEDKSATNSNAFKKSERYEKMQQGEYPRSRLCEILVDLYPQLKEIYVKNSALEILDKSGLKKRKSKVQDKKEVG